MNSLKKAKIENNTSPRRGEFGDASPLPGSHLVRILEINHSGKWLVEWSDKTRTWEDYENIKNIPSFQKVIQTLVQRKNEKQPVYIV
jgi:hypothetical protein